MNNQLKLRDYQINIANDACIMLKSHKIAYLSMQVRTGKTITAFQTAKNYGAKCVLFVTKKKAISSIEQDYLTNYKSNFICFCINYESIHRLPMVNFDLIILDEAHCMGQFPKPSDRTEMVKKLCVGKPIIYLSGTPSPESYSQLYHQFWVSSFSPFKEKNFYDWANIYVNKKPKYVFNRQLIDYSEAKKDLIDSIVSKYFLSYSQEEAGFEMPVNEHFHSVKMSNITYELVKRLRVDKVVKLKDNSLILSDTELKLLQKLHQCYSGTVISEFEDNESKKVYNRFDDSKVRYIFDKFKGQKIAIFYKFEAEERMLTEYMLENDISFTDCPVAFDHIDFNVFISQIQSGREGINLSCADCLVMLNIDFSAVSYWQSRARLQTKDRQKSADVHWIFAQNGIEPNIYKAVSNKKDYTLNYFRRDEKNDTRIII